MRAAVPRPPAAPPSAAHYEEQWSAASGLDPYDVATYGKGVGHDVYDDEEEEWVEEPELGKQAKGKGKTKHVAKAKQEGGKGKAKKGGKGKAKKGGGEGVSEIRRGGWFNRCQRLAESVLKEDWQEATTLAEELYCGTGHF